MRCLPTGSVGKQGSGMLSSDLSGDCHLTATSAAGLSGLTVTPPTEFEGAINFTVSAQTHDGSSASSIVSRPVAMTINPVSDTPSVAAATATVSVDQKSALSGKRTNAAGRCEVKKNTVSVTLHGLPA